MYNFDPYNVLLSIATNIPVLLMTAFVLQGHIYYMRTVGSVDREYVLFNKNKLYFQNDIIFFPNIVSGVKVILF